MVEELHHVNLLELNTNSPLFTNENIPTEEQYGTPVVAEGFGKFSFLHIFLFHVNLTQYRTNNNHPRRIQNRRNTFSSEFSTTLS